MTITKIKTPFRRELTVEKDNRDTYLQVTGDDWGTKHDVKTYLPKVQVNELVSALLGENATVVTDLPEVTLSQYGHPTANNYSRTHTQHLDELLDNAKALLAIHAHLVKHNAEQEAAKVAEAEAVKAKEEANAKRRDELAKEFTDSPTATYACCFNATKAGIDRVIELEEAAQVS